MSFVPAPLVLRFTNGDVTRLTPEAAFVARQYEARHESVYETNATRILRGLIAEDVLAGHRGAARAPVTAPWLYPYDVAPDIEVRTVVRPDRLERWDGVALTLYDRDRGKLSRRWVLAMLDYDRMDVRYLGWETGPALLLPEPVWAESRKGKRYRVIGLLYPDSLRGMEELA